MCISWPGHIKDLGGVRNQFHHVIDIVPTIFEATGISAPDTINGIKQRPIEGVSMVYTWDKANANAPTKHTTQYFEMLGNRAIYHDGWIAAARHRGTVPFDADVWELYDTMSDWTQAHDLAHDEPERLAELQRLWLIEAARHQVLPMDDRVAE